MPKNLTIIMDMVQVHAFPCSKVLYGANNVIFLSIQFISN